MENTIKSLNKVICDLEILKKNIEELFIDDKNEIDEKIEMVYGLRDNHFTIDEISNLTGFSIREVIDILDL